MPWWITELQQGCGDGPTDNLQQQRGIKPPNRDPPSALKGIRCGNALTNTQQYMNWMPHAKFSYECVRPHKCHTIENSMLQTCNARMDAKHTYTCLSQNVIPAARDRMNITKKTTFPATFWYFNVKPTVFHLHWLGWASSWSLMTENRELNWVCYQGLPHILLRHVCQPI